eukprot:2387859-Pleurochrysis_carterae.AAC.6
MYADAHGSTVGGRFVSARSAPRRLQTIIRERSRRSLEVLNSKRKYRNDPFTRALQSSERQRGGCFFCAAAATRLLRTRAAANELVAAIGEVQYAVSARPRIPCEEKDSSPSGGGLLSSKQSV